MLNNEHNIYKIYGEAVKTYIFPHFLVVRYVKKKHFLKRPTVQSFVHIYIIYFFYFL